MQILIEKVRGGIGQDAWAASMTVDDEWGSVRVHTRGETREKARINLSYAIRRMIGVSTEVANEMHK